MDQVINKRKQRWLDFMSMDCPPGSVFQISLPRGLLGEALGF